MRSNCLAAIGAICLLTGCAGEKFVGRPDLTLVQSGELPAPTRQDLILQERPYLIGPLDRLNVEVYGLPELSRTVQVDASGTIDLPLLGRIEASGKSPSELSALIGQSLRGRYVRNPQVIVNADTVNQNLTVDGEVDKPGPIPVAGHMTLMRAIAAAQGTTKYANTSYVVVFRRVGSQDMAALYDVRAIRQGMYADPEVFANDLIYVGEAAGRRTFETLVQGAGLLVAPLVAVIQR